jgi:tetratricopeptide (TPR) repeat protein
MQRWDERLVLIEKAERTYRDALHDPDRGLLESPDARNVWLLGGLLAEKSDALSKLERKQDAEEALQESLDIFTKVAAAHRDMPNYQWSLGDARGREAAMARAAGDQQRADAADKEKQRLFDEYERIRGTWQDRAQDAWDRAVASVNKGADLYNAKDPEAALAEFEAAELVNREYLRERPGDPRAYVELANTNHWIELVRGETGKKEQRKAPLTAAMHAAQIAAWTTPPGSTANKEDDPLLKARDALLKARHALSLHLYEDVGEFSAVLPMVQENIAVAESLLRSEPTNAVYQWNVGISQCLLGQARQQAETAGWREAIESGVIYIDKAIENASAEDEKQGYRDGKAGCEANLQQPEEGLASSGGS